MEHTQDAVNYCKYNSQQVADRKCFDCGAGLCSAGSCGYLFEDHRFCNECWDLFETEDEKESEAWEDRNGRCWSCGELLEPIWENQGWDGVEGPRHDEITGFRGCEGCAYVEE